MADIRLFFTEGLCDIGILNDDIETDEGLETAVNISLFSDAYASEEILPGDDIYRGGYLFDSDDEVTGSLLWTLRREKQLPEAMSKAKTYAQSALKWMLKSGLAESIDVQVSNPHQAVLFLEISIKRPRKQPMKFTYDLAWNAQEQRSTA